MASTFAKSVSGATKIKLAAPKSKYIEHILIATHSGEHGVAEIFRALQNRLRDSTWTVVFKSLIVVHLMIREGQPEVTLKHLAQSPHRKLAISNFTEAQTQGRNIRTYAEYLLQRAVSYSATKVDYVRGGEGRLKRLTVEKGLLRETESVQDQIRALLRCDFLSNELENEITVTAFRLLTMDLLALFHVMNEGTINVLEHYLEMSKSDAERALKLYKSFTKQTDHVVKYLSTARQFEYATRLEIPKIKHAPTSLSQSLEEHLHDKDFEINRRQYLAQMEAKRTGKPISSTAKSSAEPKASEKKPATSQAFPEPKASQSTAQPKAPAPDLMDFFESIEQNQQTMAQPSGSAFHPQQQQQQQQAYMQQTGNPWQGGVPQAMPGVAFPQQNTGFAPQPQQNIGFAQQPQPSGAGFATSTNPFGPGPQQAPPAQQPMFPGSNAFSSVSQPAFNPQQPTLSAIPQNGVASFTPPQQEPNPSPFPNPQNSGQPPFSNPFRQSMMPTGASNPTSPATPSNPMPASSLAPTPTGTNPFAKAPFQPSPFPSSLPPPSSPPFFQPPQQPGALQPQPTGTNPFARDASPSSPPPPSLSPPAPVTAHVTGSTNPFRQSAFVNPQTGAGWQHQQQQATGLNHLETIPVFPRPGLPQQQQPQQQNPSWG
ncbi:ANTH-domain-containing protein [Eremomyces bilateralis CBS 781.70]|uniref:ANTH-domain-containing protein n=1 Tax=Eremomyces bilateralis CBS 781.70 TaxID=1392243 RepID=A0A6G1FX80_9PEZI|nr:ANTH-domain-containing protein [Eremomyces bilateralis CBS 781.70]KAF1810447.1 ANTH-domain-containing protein [Eremomyces bilateralis CBS 781.70]